MKEISCNLITTTVEKLCIEANKILPDDIVDCVKCSVDNEIDELPKAIMTDIYNNIFAAKELDIPVCQDTGMAVVFLEIGQDVHIVGGSLEEAVNQGVSQGYINGLLRKSVVSDPLNRINTNDNTPAIIHTKIVDGENIRITVAPKGFGSENMSAVKMLTPAANRDTIINSVLEIVNNVGANPCPPMVIGIGIGGDFEYCAYLSKKALCRPDNEQNSSEYYRELENELLEKINELNIGPQGFGGKTTALKVNIEHYPTHIAGLPLAVNIGCHVTRHKSAIIWIFY